MRASAPGFFSLIRLLTGLVGIGTPVLLAKALSITDFAIYATITAASGLMLVVSNLGLDRACLRLLPSHAGAVALSSLARFMAMLMLPRMAALALVLVLVIASGIWLPVGSGANYSALLLILLSLSSGASQMSAAFMQGLLMHGAYAVIVFLSVVLRFVWLLVLILLGETLHYAQVIEIFIAVELLSLLAQSAAIVWFTLRGEITSSRSKAMPTLRDVFKVSGANYFTYLAGIPWMGNSQVLLVGVFCSHEIIAAFAFFQNLIERAKPFMPVRLLQIYVEPQWAKLHQADGRVRRFQAPLATLQKSNALLLSLGLVLIFTVGDALLRQFTRPLYADQILLLGLVLMQQATGSIADLLWMGINATNQVDKLVRAFSLISLGAAPLLIPAVMFGGAEGMIVWTWMLPILLLILLRHSGVHFAQLMHQTRKTMLLLLAGLVAGWIGGAFQTIAEPGMQTLAAALLIGMVVWLALLMLVKPFNRAERHLLKRFVSTKRSAAKS